MKFLERIILEMKLSGSGLLLIVMLNFMETTLIVFIFIRYHRQTTFLTRYISHMMLHILRVLTVQILMAENGIVEILLQKDCMAVVMITNIEGAVLYGVCR